MIFLRNMILLIILHKSNIIKKIINGLQDIFYTLF